MSQDPRSHPSAEEVDPLLGATLGSYVVTGRIGAGAMGVVYRARQPDIEKTVAIKVLNANMAAMPEQLKRLIEEAKAVSAIKHQGIIQVFGFGKTPTGQQYIVMEHLEGEPLDAYLARRGKLPVPEAMAVLTDVLAAVGAAHKAGIVHRDLKPANIFLSRQSDGSQLIKVLDFGLAKKASLPGGWAQQTAMQGSGTPAYAAPEQSMGENVGPLTDLYAIGCIAHELITGKVPFHASSAVAMAMEHVQRPPPPLRTLEPSVPPGLEALVLQLLEKEPQRRPQSADVVLAQLRQARRAPAPPPPKKGGLWIAAGVAALVVVGGGVAGVVLQTGEARREVDADRVLKGQLAFLQDAKKPPEERVTSAIALQAGHPGQPDVDRALTALDTELEMQGRAALASSHFKDAIELLSQASRLPRHGSDVAALLSRASSGLNATRGMVSLGAFWIDVYEYPNQAGKAPRVNVDLDEAQQLCAAAGKRLCTEEEWQQACEGAQHRPFPYGEAYDPAACATGSKAALVSAAGSFRRCASEAGVFDLSGNAAEWTSTAKGPGALQRIIRGGSWRQSGTAVSCRERDYFLPGHGGASFLGFRCCL